MEFPHLQGAGRHDRSKEVRRAAGRQGAARIGGENAEIARTQVEAHTAQGSAADHIIPVKRPNAHAFVSGAAARGGQAVEHIDAHVNAIGPYAQLGIIIQPGVRGIISTKTVLPPAAGHRVAGFRDGNTFVIRAVLRIRPGKIGHNPAIHVRIVNHYRIAVVIGIAGSASAIEESIQRVSRQAGTRLIENSHRVIDCLDIVIGANITMCIRRPASSPVGQVEAFEALLVTRHCQNPTRSLDNRVNKIGILPAFRIQTARRGHFDQRRAQLGANLRQIAHIQIKRSRVNNFTRNRAANIKSRRCGNKMGFKLFPCLHAAHLTTG